jgi:hypothetical protein
MTTETYTPDSISGEVITIIRPDAGSPFGLAYLDPPGPGRLVASHMPDAGADEHGNAYPAGEWRDESPRLVTADVAVSGWGRVPAA